MKVVINLKKDTRERMRKITFSFFAQPLKINVNKSGHVLFIHPVAHSRGKIILEIHLSDSGSIPANFATVATPYNSYLGFCSKIRMVKCD